MATYCISDIHGHYDELMEMLKLIHFSDEDKMYVLGDIVDKGKDSIKTLLFLMNDSRFTVLLGNHDYMMYSYLRNVKNGVSAVREERLWMMLNYGYQTYLEYMQCSDELQQQIYDYISSLPVLIPDVVVKDKKYYLVHSSPDFSYTEKVGMKELGDEEDTLVPFIWERWFFTECEITTIAGHTINRSGKIHHYSQFDYWDIDCGCAANIALGCLRLDDMSEFYIPCK